MACLRGLCWDGFNLWCTLMVCLNPPAVDWPPNLLIEKRTLYDWAIAYFVFYEASFSMLTRYICLSLAFWKYLWFLYPEYDTSEWISDMKNLHASWDSAEFLCFDKFSEMFVCLETTNSYFHMTCIESVLCFAAPTGENPVQFYVWKKLLLFHNSLR